MGLQPSPMIFFFFACCVILLFVHWCTLFCVGVLLSCSHYCFVFLFAMLLSFPLSVVVVVFFLHYYSLLLFMLLFSSIFCIIILLSYLRCCYPLCAPIQGLSLSLLFALLLSFSHCCPYFAICHRILYYTLPFPLVGWGLGVIKS